MSSKAITSAGSTISIGDALPATYDQAGFEAITWQDVGEVTDLGEFGKVFTLVTHLPLATRQQVKRKGSFNNGQITMQLAVDSADPGQADVKAALETDNSYAFRIRSQDGTSYYFSAQVMSFPINTGSADQITAASIQLEIDDEIVEVAATTVDLAYAAGANGTLVGNAAQTVPFGSDGTPVAAVADSGFGFVSWSDGSTQNPRLDLNAQVDITVTASFV